jgi:hypothetical protein
MGATPANEHVQNTKRALAKKITGNSSPKAAEMKITNLCKSKHRFKFVSTACSCRQ